MSIPWLRPERTLWSAVKGCVIACLLVACSSDESPNPTSPAHNNQANISGTVRDGIGPINGMTLTFKASAWVHASVITDENGSYSVAIRPSIYDVFVTPVAPTEGAEMQLQRVELTEPGFYDIDLDLASVVVDVEWATAADGEAGVILRWNSTTLGVQPVSILEGTGHAEMRGLLPVPVLIGVQLPDSTNLLYPPYGFLSPGAYRTLLPGETAAAKLELFQGAL